MQTTRIYHLYYSKFETQNTKLATTRIKFDKETLENFRNPLVILTGKFGTLRILTNKLLV